MIQLLKIRHVVGKKSLRWLYIGAFSGVCLALIELLFSYLLVVLFSLLGFSMASRNVTVATSALPIISQPWLVGALFLFAGVARGCFQLLVRESALLARELSNARLKLLVFDSLLRTQKYRSSFPMSYIQNLLFEVFPRATQYCYFSAYFFPAALQVLLTGVLLFFYSPLYAAVGGGLLSLAGLMIVSFQKSSRRQSRAIPAIQADLMRMIHHSLSNWFLIKALRKTSDHFHELARMISSRASKAARAYFFGALSSVMPLMMGTVIIVALIVIQLQYSWIDGARFVAFAYLFVRFLQNLGGALTYYSQAMVSEPHFLETALYVEERQAESSDMKSFDEIDELLAQGMSKGLPPLRSGAEISGSIDGVGENIAPPSISFHDVSYRYNDQQDWVVQQLSFLVNGGGSLGIMGPSGAGKSTVLALSLGLTPPVSGTILLDGESVESYIKARPSVLSYVGPESYLFEGTLKQNLTYGSHGAVSDELIWQTLELVDLKSEIERRGGLDIELGGDRDQFSSGQRQRLSIARALCQKPKFLILDEVTANLDVESERKVFQAIAALSGRVTRLVVSHNPELAAHVDQVVKLR